jgi:hypothetical protein
MDHSLSANIHTVGKIQTAARLRRALLQTLQSAQHDVSMKPPALEAQTDLWRDSVPQLMTIEVLEAGL